MHRLADSLVGQRVADLIAHQEAGVPGLPAAEVVVVRGDGEWFEPWGDPRRVD